MIHQIPFRILETTKPAPELLSGNAKRLSPLCFHNLTNPSSTCPSLIDFYFLCFIHLQIPFLAKRLFSHLYKTPRVSPTRVPEIPDARPRKRLKPLVFILLPTLCRRQKSHLHWNQQLPHSFAKTPGVGVGTPRPFLDSKPPDSKTRARARNHR
jgi:hypothetical protein